MNLSERDKRNMAYLGQISQSPVLYKRYLAAMGTTAILYRAAFFLVGVAVGATIGWLI